MSDLPVSKADDITGDDYPDIDLGAFNFGFVTEGTTRQLPERAQAPPPLGVLGFLEGKTFKGEGFNTIFRPRSSSPLFGIPVPGNAQDNDLELNLTQETLTFSKNIGTVPNRGLFTQPDIALGGITYVQSVQDVTNQNTGLPNGKPTDIHIEPGIWMSVPANPPLIEPEHPSRRREVFSARTQAVNHGEKSVDIAKFEGGRAASARIRNARFATGFGHDGQFVANSMT